MTTDAKVGLLLGLAFIFIIAFIINGLPSFRDDADNNELTTNMVSWQSKPPVIAARERKIINRRESVEKKPPEPAPSSTTKDDVRFTTALPKSPPAVVEMKTPTDDVPKTKTYVVNEGDSLAVIARKVYGPQQGSKKTNVARIFDANRRLLKSPDEIYVGQELTIPPLSSASTPDKGDRATLLSGTGFTKVESIGARHLSAGSSKTEKSKLYTVREGDSLWQIAEEQLGDGNRYSDIVKLNTDILTSEDEIAVGMQLKIPPR